METAVDIQSQAAISRDHSLTLVAKQGNRRQEMTKHKGSDNALSIYLFLNERMVKLVKRDRCETVSSTYKEALLSKSGMKSGSVVSMGTPIRTPSQWSHEVVNGHDLSGLTWILKMHANEVITRREAMATPTEGEISWTRDKFEAINKKGKCDILKYLSIKTGCEFTAYNPNGRAKILIKEKERGG
jgi:hypothetical protein